VSSDIHADTPRARVIRLVRHPLGPRLLILGRRIHEWHAGVVLLLAGLGASALDVTFPWHMRAGTIAIGFWLVAKDWRDMTPGGRDTAAWSMWLHPRANPLRAHRRAAWVAPVLGTLVAVTASINLASALTPSLTNRLSNLHAIVPPGLVTDAHALSVPVSVLLLAVSIQVIRRRRHAWTVAVSLLVGAGVLNLIKGLDVEEAALSWALAACLWGARPAFYVEAPRNAVRTTLSRSIPMAGLATAVAVTAVWFARGSAHPALGIGGVIDEAVTLLVGGTGRAHFAEHYTWLPAALAALGLLTLVTILHPLFQRLRTPIGVPAAGALGRAHAVLRAHGSGTLGFFSLRADHQFLFSPDRRAYLAFQVEGGVVTVAGDPVGDAASVPGLVRSLADLAERRGLRIAVIGAGAATLDLWRGLGLRAVYLGDEAIVDTSRFSLEGRPIRKVRQSVTRLTREGYVADVHRVGDLTPDEITTLDAISTRWRGGRPERGFSMALEQISGSEQADCLVIAARDASGTVRGFLHFAPVYGQSAMSLAFMRRDPDTPNGLTEFLVCAAIQRLRDRGVERVSLNFAAFGRLMRAPRNMRERLIGRVIRLGDRWFQISSLLRFNEKFFPDWEPRYLMCEGASGAARAGLAAAWLEGHLPRLRRREPRTEAPAFPRRTTPTPSAT
jgi:lysyl-tRNA synthetase class 2